ncbi:putative acyl esterase [Lipingzhangella halophila]|uniref:Putative acyl esterase n=1 Tax=Lipingzhangella halophila TaxID=1783352 RepID=A0A7W7RJI6_9ACTN|nr:CocE/NonD family hydrolase [Lipingzhangella halophila]MBB4933154.1 putative acyl esterase [Lipingzhangella halophila]
MRRTSITASCALSATVLATALAPPAHAESSSLSFETIPGSDGVDLSAISVTPDEEGPHPLLVLPAAWSMHASLFTGAASKLAYESGYQVVVYTTRGFYDSGGGVEVAGPEDVADASAVIDWALDNTGADPEAIGMGGISYGAGISLLTSASDDRVDAVGAMSGWSDLESSLYPNETINFQAVELLLLSGELTGTPGETLEHVRDEYRDGNVEPALEMAPERSPATKVDAINTNDPAVLLAHPYNDGIFPVEQIPSFYEELDTDKRLMLAPGDHATPELFGAAGLPNRVWEDLTRWFDHHLKGEDNGIGTEDPVHLQENSAGGEWATYPDWPSATAATETHYLEEPERSFSQWQPTGGMSKSPAPGWDYPIDAGAGTTAQSGTILVSGALQQFLDLPTGVSLPLVNRNRAGVWSGPEYPDGTTISGTPSVEVEVTPTTEETSLFFYLYATTRHGTGELITHKPYTLRGATPGEAATVRVDLQSVVRDVAPGRHLTLVMDTDDPRYTGESERGERVTVSSSEKSPAAVTVPLA